MEFHGSKLSVLSVRTSIGVISMGIGSSKPSKPQPERHQWVPGPIPPVIQQPAVVPPAPPAIPPAPPLEIRRPLLNDREMAKEIARHQYLQNIGGRLLRQEADRLRNADPRGANNSLFATWHQHVGTIDAVLNAARPLMEAHLRIRYPGLSPLALSLTAEMCLTCHHGLDGGNNYFA